jgi:hypothetical protein
MMKSVQEDFYSRNTAARGAQKYDSVIFPGAKFTISRLKQAEEELAKSASKEPPGDFSSLVIDLREITSLVDDPKS